MSSSFVVGAIGTWVITTQYPVKPLAEIPFSISWVLLFICYIVVIFIASFFGGIGTQAAVESLVKIKEKWIGKPYKKKSLRE